MSTRKAIGAPRRSERHALVALLGGVRVGNIYQASSGALRFAYLEEWRNSKHAYPLSLSMPLTAQEHRHEAIGSFLWGLLPDNQRTLDQYGRIFGVSARNPVALLSHLGADCAGAVQFAPPETADELEGSASRKGAIDWLTEKEVGEELKTVREQGIPGASLRTVGQFSLAGAQPKIALLEEDGKWGRPTGRIPTNRILKPPSGEFRGFAENEHFCLELAASLELGSVKSRVIRFAGEVAMVVDRFDRAIHRGAWVRIHQEDFCQALGVMPTQKYENEGGPGIPDLIALLQEASTKPDDDVARFIRATALNWVLAATDAHAKNYALLHNDRGVRLAPFYDILSYLPYADAELHRVKLAMRIGREYLVRRVHRRSWSDLANECRLSERTVVENVLAVLEALPGAIDRTAERSIREGLDSTVIEGLRERVQRRVARCREIMGNSHSAADSHR
jgi:serine/threonine-protein kinase HipA